LTTIELVEYPVPDDARRRVLLVQIDSIDVLDEYFRSASLSEKNQDRVRRFLDVYARTDQPLFLPKEHVRSLGAGLAEMKPKGHRILFFTHRGGNVIVLLCVAKLKDKQFQRAIERARHRWGLLIERGLL
jgi:phage-related protein